MKNRWTASLLAVAAIAGTFYSMQPAKADYFYRHERHNEMKAARQQADANYDLSTGSLGRAAMHERKAVRDENRAYRYGGW
jgi:hypothetical protein